MSAYPTLVFLHGVGKGCKEEGWKVVLNTSLSRLDYPTIDEVNVIAPIYAHALKGTDDEMPVPPITIKDLPHERAREHRWSVDSRTSSLERILGSGNTAGSGFPGANQVVEVALGAPFFFAQARNYLRNPHIRANVLERILRVMPDEGEILIVGHSLGSVIAADLIRRLPPAVRVVGLVTIGSPLANGEFDVDNLRVNLEAPPENLEWWVNLWDGRDPVSAKQGVSTLFPWMLDLKVTFDPRSFPHSLDTFLASDMVARAIGHGLFGSLSKELVHQRRELEVTPNCVETLTLLALNYGHLVASHLDPKVQKRYRAALRETQLTALERLLEQARVEDQTQASAITQLMVNPLDEDGWANRPDPIRHLSKQDAADLLVTIALANVIVPFEITVPQDDQRAAFEELTTEMGLGRQIGLDLFSSRAAAEKILQGSSVNVFKWAALGVGVLATVITAGLALVAVPVGLTGAAAITSALAAFGPGGMVGGLLTAGALVTVSSGGIASSLASSGASLQDVETLLMSKLTVFILREKQKLEPDPSTWPLLMESEQELRRLVERLSLYSDSKAPALKTAKAKLSAVEKALAYVNQHKPAPEPPRFIGSATTKE